MDMEGCDELEAAPLTGVFGAEASPEEKKAKIKHFEKKAKINHFVSYLSE